MNTELILEKVGGEAGSLLARIATKALWLLSTLSVATGLHLVFFELHPETRLRETSLLCLALFLWIALLMSYIAYLHLRQRLDFRFGVLWDHRRQPYCPVHRVGLRNPADWGKTTGLECRLCFWEGAPDEAKSQKYIRVTDDVGNEISLSEARTHCRDEGEYIGEQDRKVP